jgi:hypothetical protein
LRYRPSEGEFGQVGANSMEIDVVCAGAPGNGNPIPRSDFIEGVGKLRAHRHTKRYCLLFANRTPRSRQDMHRAGTVSRRDRAALKDVKRDHQQCTKKVNKDRSMVLPLRWLAGDFGHSTKTNLGISDRKTKASNKRPPIVAPHS